MKIYRVFTFASLLLLLNNCTPVNHVYISNYTTKHVSIQVNCKVGDIDLRDISYVIANDSLYSSIRFLQNETFPIIIQVSENTGESYSTILKPETTTFLLPTDLYTPIESISIGGDTIYLKGKHRNRKKTSKSLIFKQNRSILKGTLIKILE